MEQKMKVKKEGAQDLIAMGHTACAGCGELLGLRLALNAAGPDIICTFATGCIEITTSRYPESAWMVPAIHSLFENSAAVASGIETALRAAGRKGTKVVAIGGDGATADIGMGCISGMFERGHNVMYLCFDNEAYMNTGVQRSGLTPTDARTTTTPPGNVSSGNPKPKKNMPEIAVAHGVSYVATTSVGYPKDIERKIKNAMAVNGPSYVQIHVPCPLGWGFDTALTAQVAQLAVQSGLYPLFEKVDGEITKVTRIARKKTVEEYLKLQRRFKHLGKAELARFEELAADNIERFSLA
ncbi:MAG: thiamine pyrophosphate-dependent enzyme [Terriglobia bacterium]